MAKKGIVEREKKRKTIIAKYNKIREEYLTQLKKAQSGATYLYLFKKIQKLPKNSNKIRAHNRCWETGRPRGYYKYFGLSKNALRNSINKGFLPGIIKSSW